MISKLPNFNFPKPRRINEDRNLALTSVAFLQARHLHRQGGGSRGAFMIPMTTESLSSTQRTTNLRHREENLQMRKEIIHVALKKTRSPTRNRSRIRKTNTKRRLMVRNNLGRLEQQQDIHLDVLAALIPTHHSAFIIHNSSLLFHGNPVYCVSVFFL